MEAPVKQYQALLLGYQNLVMITQIFTFSFNLPIELSKQVFVTDIGEQLDHLQSDQNKPQIQKSKLHASRS